MKNWAMVAALVLVLVAGVITSLLTGPVEIPPDKVFRALWQIFDGASSDDVGNEIVRNLRLPQVILAILVGAALAQSGAAMQGFFQNPMADPFIIGISSGAALGATLAVFLSLDIWVAGVNAVAGFAFVGAVVVTFIVYVLSVRCCGVPVTTVLITGIAVGS